MDGGVLQLESAGVGSAVSRVDRAVFRLGIVRVHAADRGEREITVRADLRDHGA